ncbi:hypothetical protein LQ757_03290 [Agromyces sp. SYSU K20354]|uniref:hypothetical protein n=1 Tax=Agromyces cavernae TaxID=2898659 RepID=UPI001E2D8955|nr:hypothetical protein [Agromyces cavernae]MCD2441296.1 hypothetical protein [Agromyces cavernae]
MNPHEPSSWEKNENESPTDDLEGEYTETDGEAAHERTVHGQYTRSDDEVPEGEREGSYTDANDEGPTHPTSERHGKFIRRDQ